MKTYGIHFCYKNRSARPLELADIYINTFHDTSTVYIAKNRCKSNIFQTYVTHSVGHLDILWRENTEIQNALL